MAAHSKRRIVITGLGTISPLGDTPDALWAALIAGQSGVGELKSLPPDALSAIDTRTQKTYSVNIAGEATCFTGDADNYGPVDKELKKTIRKGSKVMCREIQMGVAAAQRSLFHSGLIPGPKYSPERAGILFGSDYMLTIPDEFSAGIAACITAGKPFDEAKWATDAFPKLYPLWLLKYLPNMPAAHVSIFNDLRGPNNSLTMREASSNLAVGEAFRVIERGHADVMVAGATGTRVHSTKSVHACQTEQLAQHTDPTKASRPFDKNRNGMVLGEGAGSVVLEELEHALARGANIYGEVIGQASSMVSSRNFVANKAAALANVLRASLNDAKLSPEELGHVHAHGLSSTSCDVDEATAIHTALAARGKTVPVVAAKSNFGNLGAASGMVELIASTLALGAGNLFPVLNYETPDEACGGLNIVRSSNVVAGETFVNLSVTPQGQASAIVVRAWRG